MQKKNLAIILECNKLHKLFKEAAVLLVISSIQLHFAMKKRKKKSYTQINTFENLILMNNLYDYKSYQWFTFFSASMLN